MRDHPWRSKSGRPWSLRVRSDLCAVCGGTPDSHPPDRPDTERERALMLADAVLDRPNADPDDDLSILARGLVREASRTAAPGLDEEGDLDPVVAAWLNARADALRVVAAHRASPPEYPGLALVPVADLDRLGQYVELSKTRAALATPPPAAPGLREAVEVVIAARHQMGEPERPRSSGDTSTTSERIAALAETPGEPLEHIHPGAFDPDCALCAAEPAP